MITQSKLSLFPFCRAFCFVFRIVHTKQDRRPRQSQSPRSLRSPPASPSRRLEKPSTSPRGARARTALKTPSVLRNTPVATATTTSPFRTPDRVGNPASGASPPSGPRTPETDDTTAGLLGSPGSSRHGGADSSGGSPFPLPPLEAQQLLDTGGVVIESQHGRGGVGGRGGSSGAHGGNSDNTMTITDGAGDGGGGGDAAAGRDATLASLLLSSPGKDYWVGRIAEGQASPSGSRTSPTFARREKKETTGTLHRSPSNRPAWNAGSSPRRQPRQQDADFNTRSPVKGPLSLSPGRRGAPRSPGSSAWSTEAFVSPGRRPTSPSGDILSFSPGGGGGLFDLSPAKSGQYLSPAGRVRQHVSNVGQSGVSARRAGASSSRRAPFSTSPARDPLGSSFGRGSRSVSPMQRQVREERLVSWRLYSSTARSTCSIGMRHRTRYGVCLDLSVEVSVIWTIIQKLIITGSRTR